MTKMIPVAAGIVFDRTTDLVLIAQRDTGEWEFPGGKVEPGEETWETVSREIIEELGLRVLVGDPVFTMNNHDREPGINYVVVFHRCETWGEPTIGLWQWIDPALLVTFRLVHLNMVRALSVALG